MKDAVRAYAAGLLDGEGSIQINPSKGAGSKRYWCLTVQVASNNKDVLEWLQEQFRSGSITSWKSKHSTQGKVSHNWRLYSQEAVAFLKSVKKFMRMKDGQAEIALEFAKLKGKLGSRLTPEVTSLRSSLAKDIRILNRTTGKGVLGAFPEGVL